MKEEHRIYLEEEFRKHGSLPAFLEAMARSESNGFRQLRREVQEGPWHPSGEDLYNYVLGWLESDQLMKILDHIVLCEPCLEDVMRIRGIEEDLTREALERANRTPLVERIKRFVTDLSFPVFVQLPALDPVRREAGEPPQRSFSVDTALTLGVQAPGDGFITVIYACEATGVVKLVFPVLETDNPRVVEGREAPPIDGVVEGPSGKHFFKIFWTREPLLQRVEADLADEQGTAETLDRFLDAVQDLPHETWRETVYEYEVVGG